MEWILTSERLSFRKIKEDDFSSLCNILQDKEIMYAWEHEFSDSEVREWINKNNNRYLKDGFSYYAVIEKAENAFIGVIGPLMEELNGADCIGVAYILDKRFWGKGYAYEGAKTCVEYAFGTLGAHKVIAQVRPENIPSCKVAEKLGMEIESEFIKAYKGKNMLHYIYSLTR